MCSNYTLKVQESEWKEYFEKESFKVVSVDKRFLPYQEAPVLVRLSEASYKLAAMKFSLVPSWSKEPKVKFATHNARIETVSEKPTWKIPFIKKHCIVPMSSFFESVYEGPMAGNIIEFSEKKDHLMFAAGIYDQWVDSETKKASQSFSILTTTPSEFILHHGHDRTPIFLGTSAVKSWLDVDQQSDRYWLDFLKNEESKPELKVRIERALKPGWEKRK